MHAYLQGVQPLCKECVSALRNCSVSARKVIGRGLIHLFGSQVIARAGSAVATIAYVFTGLLHVSDTLIRLYVKICQGRCSPGQQWSSFYLLRRP